MGKPVEGGFDFIHFNKLIDQYQKLQKQVVSRVKSLAKLSSASPGQFLLVQFYLSQVTQIGDSISNMVAQINSMINNSIRNFKST